MITGAARRVGRSLALAIANAGANVLIHHSNSSEAALETQAEIIKLGRQAHILQANFSSTGEIQAMIARVKEMGPLYALVNNAAIFEPLSLAETSLESWNQHLTINLTAPFLLSQAFAEMLPEGESGRIVNILDWRAIRPAADHFPYTVSKAGLAALTKSLAVALAPHISVNGLALGAVLPPSDGAKAESVLAFTPIRRWASLDEVADALLFLLTGPQYITGEVIHVDGGRHLI